MDKYNKVKMIGKGSFGSAMLAIHKRTSRAVVIKQIQVQDEDFERVLVEVEALMKCGSGHINVCRYRDSFLSKSPKDTLCIVMDYYNGGDLQNFLKTQTSQLPEEV
mmetsp:Transcript_3753/g.5638  ORF Transcript_3753/g.5638 Transcript_3753/m.5638 type:complete len:106 (+) Transcript_3753:75-392(+)